MCQSGTEAHEHVVVVPAAITASQTSLIESYNGLLEVSKMDSIIIASVSIR